MLANNRRMKGILRQLKNQVTQANLSIKSLRQCPICSWKGRQFAPGGAIKKRRFDCRCPKCGSFERHRLAYTVAEKLVNLDYTSVLHIAPEKELEKWLRHKSDKYLSIDLYRSAMKKMDVTDLKLEDESKSLIWCSHVLEHVENDRQAIREFYRVLAPKGIAFIQVPIWKHKTYEDETIKSPDKRLNTFYQSDHLRLYGYDISERFEDVGFRAKVYRAQDFGPELLLYNGLSFASTDEVFMYQKI